MTIITLLLILGIPVNLIVVAMMPDESGEESMAKAVAFFLALIPWLVWRRR